MKDGAFKFRNNKEDPAPTRLDEDLAVWKLNRHKSAGAGGTYCINVKLINADIVQFHAHGQRDGKSRKDRL